MAHAAIAGVMLLALVYLWWCGLTGRRGRLLNAAVAALASESTVVLLNHGDCPLGPLQARVGDPVPLFELALPPRAAKLAVPVLGAVFIGGVVVLAGGKVRSPGFAAAGRGVPRPRLPIDP